MKIVKSITNTGVVAELNGQFWGRQRDDGNSTSEGFGPIERAHISDPAHCKKPTDMTWDPKSGGYNPHIDPLSRARLLRIVVETNYTAFEDEP